MNAHIEPSALEAPKRKPDWLTTEERFWSKVDIKGLNDPNACWNWLGSKDAAGYGFFKVDKKQYRAHRFSAALGGAPLKEGEVVCHKCDNPSCVRPSHLFIGTQRDNIQDRCDKGRSYAPVGEMNPQAKLTYRSAREIRKEYARGGVSQRKLAEKHGVSKFAIRRVLIGASYPAPKERARCAIRELIESYGIGGASQLVNEYLKDEARRTRQ